MKHLFSRSLTVLFLLVILTGTAVASTSMDLAGSIRAIQNSRSTSVADRQAGVGQTQELGESNGKGFYMAIYKDTVQHPNEQVEEQIKQRFGIDFKVDLLPPKQNGKYMFTDFFKNPFGYHSSPAVPTLRDSLQSDCVRIKAAQVDDKARQLSLLKKRLDEKKRRMEVPPSPSAPAAPPVDPVIREELLRLIEVFGPTSEAQLQQEINGLSEYANPDDNQVLLKCYQDLSSSVDFELKLQSILNPSRKQLEAMQTFINGSLDDFSTKAGFPKYDLLFDIGVIDYIFFGTPVATNVGKANEVNGETDGPGGFGNYRALEARSEPQPTLPTLPGLPDSTTSPPGSGSSTTGPTASFTPADPFATVTPGVAATEFGASSSTPAGPYCVDAPTGLSLDYSALNPSSTVAPAASGLTQEQAIARLQEERRLEEAARIAATTPPPANSVVAPVIPVSGDLAEGARSDGKNKKGLCQGNGFGFGNELMKLIFCIDIEFAKTGKTWETTREDNCIACHLYAINRIFEENVLKASVRPHKNAGTIMESAICEDGYGTAVGFQYSIEFVPVKFYKDICYPQGGVTDSTYADLVGYPEIVSKVNKEGFALNCIADFKDEEAQKRCRKAIGGSNDLSFAQFKESYLASVDRKLMSTADLKKDTSMWARLVGDQGIAQREVHLLLYRLGKDLPVYGEETKIEPIFKQRLKSLSDEMESILRDDNYSAEEKTNKLLCLKGYTLNQPGRTTQCASDIRTFRAFQKDVDQERDRVAEITRSWNVRSRDFGKENPCGMFSGSGLVDAFSKTFAGKGSKSYYLETPERQTQTLQEQLTGQIAANTELEDIGSLLSKVDEAVQSTLDAGDREKRQEEFQNEQERALVLYQALSFELATFRANIRAMTGWWADMVVNYQFVSKSGKKQNVLENFLEKLR